MRKRAWMCVIALLAGWSAMALRPAGSAAAESDDATQFVALINNLRSSEGLPPLQVHNELVGPSEAWAAQLAVNGELSHAPDLSVGITVYWTKLGENVGVGPQGQVEQLFDAFVNSPSHYQNLVDPKFTYVGVGVVYDDKGHLWTTHRFMATGESPATAPPTTAPPTTLPPATLSPTTLPPAAPSATTVPVAADLSTTTTSTSPEALPEVLLFSDAALNAATVAATAVNLDDAGI